MLNNELFIDILDVLYDDIKLYIEQQFQTL